LLFHEVFFPYLTLSSGGRGFGAGRGDGRRNQSGGRTGAQTAGAVYEGFFSVHDCFSAFAFQCLCILFLLRDMDCRAAALAAEQDALINPHGHIVPGHGPEQLGLKGFAAMGAQRLSGLWALRVGTNALAEFSARYLDDAAYRVVVEFLPVTRTIPVYVIHVTLEVGPLLLRKRFQIAAVMKALVSPAREDGIDQVLVPRAVDIGQDGHHLRGIDLLG